MLSEVYVEVQQDILKIEWQTAEIYIPLQEVIEVTSEYSPWIEQESHIINIGIPFYKNITIIRTRKFCYVLFNVDKELISMGNY
ncbi:hypothetical protein C1N66_00445 [Bacillus cereus]|uniref:Sublancin immunity protein SunI-like PH domain-containing protein n=1 Tax=Bacillus cereus TaxID=1396 RepID=A0AB73UBG4_BACCE|nr:hypothetical protein [Bacillus cereus]QHV03722.1 hypothetical protein C1N82_10365 [Bacillus cereus]QHV41717.1 hypothetical protein C1N66_00445 [Bacillus cereus]